MTAGLISSFAMIAKEYRGNITSAVDGEPLIGATVMVKGTSVGTVADIDGNWVLDVPDNA